MKKTRFLSLLLASVLAVSSLPMAVAADGTDAPANALDGATYTAATGTTITDAAIKNPDGSTTAGNHFLSTARRAYGSFDTSFVFKYNLTEEQAAQQLYFYVDVRNAQPQLVSKAVDAVGRFRFNENLDEQTDVRVFPNNKYGAWTPINNAADGVAIPLSANKIGENTVVHMRYSNLNQTHDLDFDNFSIFYKDAGGNRVYVVEPITDNFLEKGFSKGVAYIFEDVEEPYKIADSNDASNTQIDIALANEIQPGTYTLRGEFRLGVFTCTGSDSSYTAGVNDAEIIVMAGEIVGLEGAMIDTVWTEYEWEVLVPVATDTLSIIVDGKEDTIGDVQKINYRNLSLEYAHDFGLTLETEEKNLLDNVKISSEGSVVTTVAGEGVLYIPERDGAVGASQTQNYITFLIPRALKGGQKYYISFDVSAEGATTLPGNLPDRKLEFRPKTNFAIEERTAGVAFTNGMNDYWILPVEDDNQISYRTAQNADALPKSYPLYAPTTELKTFVGYFTPTADLETFSFTFQRGGSDTNSNHAMTLDNLKIWSDDGEIYSNDFSVLPTKEYIGEIVGAERNVAELSGGVMIHASVKPEWQGVKAAHTAVTTIIDGSEINAAYDTSAVAVKDGTYTFSVDVAANVDGAKAKLVINVAGRDPIVTDEIEIPNSDNEYATLSCTFNAVSGQAITSIVVDTDLTDGVLKLRNQKLTLASSEADGGSINVGFVMVLLKKKLGTTTDDGKPKISTKKNFIENGKLSKAPVIVKEGYDTNVAGWYANAAYGYRIEDGIEMQDEEMIYYDHNVEWSKSGYVTVTGRYRNTGRVWYNPVLTLEPGTYVLSVDLCTAKAGESTIVRFGAENPEDGKLLSDATSAIITNSWKTYTNQFNVRDTVSIRIPFFGGTSLKHINDFCVDNLVLKYVGPIDDTPVEVKPLEDSAANVKPAVAGNLIPNGDMAKTPEVIKEGYDASKIAWYANAGQGYNHAPDGTLLKDEPKVYHDHTITWNELGFVTVTGRIANYGRVWYNPGINLEPGTYVLSVDLRTANVGETSTLRFAAGDLDDKALAPATSAGINNTWRTFTSEFTVTDTTALRIAFFGGTGSGHKHDFCVDNIVLLKK